MGEREEVKLYFDYKSPYAYLAKDPAFELPRRYRVDVGWIPFLLRIKGKGERSLYSEHKARDFYMDARRWANRRGEPFWGHDRMPLLEERMAEAGLAPAE